MYLNLLSSDLKIVFDSLFTKVLLVQKVSCLNSLLRFNPLRTFTESNVTRCIHSIYTLLSLNTKITIEGKIAILFLPWIDRNAYRSNRKRQAAPRRLSLYESARRSRLSLSLILSLFLSPSLSPFLSLFPFCHDLVSEGIERKKKKKKKEKETGFHPRPRAVIIRERTIISVVRRRASCFCHSRHQTR